jgi:PPOX class probable F420-dependent enzyme
MEMDNGSFDFLDGQQFIALTTYRKSGEPVATPVWFTRQGESLFVYTSASSGKAKRLRKDPRVRLVASDARGTPCSESADGLASFPAEAEWPAITKLFKAKYGVQYSMFGILGRLRGQDDRLFLRISPAPAESPAKSEP